MESIILLTNCHLVKRFDKLSLQNSRSGAVLVEKKWSVWRCRYTRWDSNAENVGFGEENGVVERRKRKLWRKWMADNPPSFDIEEEEERIIDEFLEDFWVVEVVKSYGWAMLPILISWLIAIGPKGMLMVLAIPFGQSVFTFVLRKLFGEPKKKPKRKVRKRGRPFLGGLNDSDQGIDEKQSNVEGKMGYQSWVAGDDGVADAGKNRQDKRQFGGWDDLEEMESAQRRPPPMPARPRKSPPENGKLGMSARKSGTPLLLRLLIAVFPILGTWTKLL